MSFSLKNDPEIMTDIPQCSKGKILPQLFEEGFHSYYFKLLYVTFFPCNEYIFTYFIFYSENSFNKPCALVYPCLAINKDLCWLKLCRLIGPTRNSHKILLLKKNKFCCHLLSVANCSQKICFGTYYLK